MSNFTAYPRCFYILVHPPPKLENTVEISYFFLLLNNVYELDYKTAVYHKIKIYHFKQFRFFLVRSLLFLNFATKKGSNVGTCQWQFFWAFLFVCVTLVTFDTTVVGGCSSSIFYGNFDFLRINNNSSIREGRKKS